MAENPVKPESPAAALEPAPGSAGALDIAMAAEAHDPAPDSPARTVLLEQARLIREQTAHVAEERVHLAVQIRQARLTRFRERIKAARDIAVAAVLVLLVGGAGMVVWEASRHTGLVVEPFRTPPDFAARGLDGSVVAVRVLDRLAELDANSQSVRARSSYTDSWSGDVQLEIPQTGVSIGEVQRTLREQLGRQTRITGELARTGQGLALTVRSGQAPGTTVRGAEAELDAMIAAAAERIYARTQPYQYSKWLEFHGRPEEALAVARRLTTSRSESERVWAYAQVCNLLPRAGDFDGARAACRSGLQLDPSHPVALNNAALVEAAVGHEEQALALARRAARATLRRGEAFAPRWRPGAEEVTAANDARLRGDFVRAAALLRRVFEGPDVQGFVEWAGANLAMLLAQNHDARASRAIRASLAEPNVDATMGWRVDDGADTVPRWFEAAAVDDWAGAAAVMEEVAAAAATQGRLGQVAQARWIAPRLAYARARTGRLAEAQALIAGTPLDCYLCVRTRARIAAVVGDHAAADRWFAQAVRQAPSSPFAYAEWGETKLARGDAEGAVRLLREAQERGPRWADPLKLEGDALARQGKHRAALRRYAEAAERARRWGALHLAWGRSLEALGREDQARAKYAQAVRLDLSKADRAEVDRRLAKPA